VSTERVGLPIKSGRGTQQERRALEHSAARIDRPDHPVDGSDGHAEGGVDASAAALPQEQFDAGDGFSDGPG